jgi:cytochrome c oxidase assembly protein subunit 15
MFLALVLVAMLVYLVHMSSPTRIAIYAPTGFWWLIACMAVVLVQILLGTQVREAIDSVSRIADRSAWIPSIQEEFVLHRSFSWIVLLLHVGLFLTLRKLNGVKRIQLALILLILGTILSGVGLSWFDVPAFLQPVHLLLATLCFGVQFMFVLKLSGGVQDSTINELK